jgi:tetratricopeptide (TPR) repeat protein
MPAVTTDQLAAAMLAAWNVGQPGRVLALAATAAGAAMDDEKVLLLFGMAQQQTGRHAEAATTFERLCRLRPGVSGYWNNLGVARRAAGCLSAASSALGTAQSLAPDDVGVGYNLGLLYAEQHRWPEARQTLLDVVRRAPQFIEARLQAARACHVCGDSQGEESMLEGAADWPPQPAAQALTLAGMLSAQGNLDAALHALLQAQLPAGPNAEPVRLRIAALRVALYERNNQLEQARHELKQLPLTVLDALPAAANTARVEGWRVHASMALRAGRFADAVALYQRALDLAGDDEERANAAFGLAAAYDRTTCPREAWRALGAAHSAQVATVRTVAPELLVPDAKPLSMLEPTVDADARSRWRPLAAPDAAYSPVFVIGFPRSGTTLLEQMLDAHPAFQSMDERGFVYELIERMRQVGQRYPNDLATLTQIDVDQLRAVYARMVERVLPERGQRILVDKNPLNMLCLPLIMRLFPAARIILCVRHPCDAVLSCYMQAFRSPAFMAMCSTLERLARGYARAFEQYCGDVDVLQPRVLAWRYESVVNDFEVEVARLAQFLAVADATPMAGFAEHARHKRFISTPSYAEVVRPVNRAAVGRWLAYREQFEPVLPILRPWLDRFGYTA